MTIPLIECIYARSASEFESLVQDFFAANNTATIRDMTIHRADLVRVNNEEIYAYIVYETGRGTSIAGEDQLQVKLFTEKSLEDAVDAANDFAQNTLGAAGMTSLLGGGVMYGDRNIKNYWVAIAYCEAASSGFKRLAKEVTVAELSLVPRTHTSDVDDEPGDFQPLHRFDTTGGAIDITVGASTEYRAFEYRVFVKVSQDLNQVRILMDPGVTADGYDTLYLREPYDVIILQALPDGNYRVLAFTNNDRVSSYSSNTAVSPLDDVILVTTGGSTRTMSLPDPTNPSVVRKRITIIKVDAGAGIARVRSLGAGLIDGAATYDLPNQYDKITVLSDGINYHITSL